MKKVEYLQRNLLKKIIFFVFIFSWAFIAPKTTKAADTPFDITISPIFFEFTTEPGQTIKDKIKIRNNSDKTQNIAITITRLEAEGEAGDANFEQTDKSDEFPTWVNLQNSTLPVPPKEWAEIPFTINIPNSAIHGYYYGFLISPSAADGTETAQINFASGVGIPILLDVKVPGAETSATLENFKTGKKIYEYPPIDFLTSLKNTGNVHVKPRGNIFIHKKNQKDVAILEVNPDKGAILPGATRQFTTEWNNAFITREPVIEDGQTKLNDKGEVIKKISIHWDKIKDIRFGKYTANLAVVFDNGKTDTLLSAETNFWVIPYTFLAVVCGIFAFGILILWLIIRTIIKRSVKRLLKNQKTNSAKQKTPKKKV